MKYRAVMRGCYSLERDLQIFGGSLPLVEKWAKEVLKLYPEGIVEVYEVKEKVIKLIQAKKTRRPKTIPDAV